MKKDSIVYSVFIMLTIIVAFVLIQSNKVSDEELFELALNNSDVSLCGRINPDLTADYGDAPRTKVKVQGLAVLRDMCFSELAEPYDDKVIYCENVSDYWITVCDEGGCYRMSAKEACYREVFKDYVSNSLPPLEGEITDMQICEKLSMFRDNCLYLYAVTTGDNSSCELFDNRCPLRKKLCIDEANKANLPPLDLGEAVVYKST